MMIFRLALRNLFRHSRRTLLLAFLIVVGMAGLFLADAVFESTNRGLKVSFVGSLTGDLSISAKTESPFGLFGSEIPIVSEYESIPAITGYKAIVPSASKLEHASAQTSVVSGAASVNIGGFSFTAPVFGVDPASYFTVCTDIRIVSGDITSLDDKGVFLNSVIAKNAETALGRALIPGEPVVFSMYVNGSFRIRQGEFTGIHAYTSANEALNRVVLANTTLVRSLSNYTMGFSIAQGNEHETNSPSDTFLGFNLDDLFSGATDTVADPETALSLESVETQMADTASRDALVKTDEAAWSFVLFRAKPGEELELFREVKNLSRINSWEVQIQDWRGTAGSTATLPYVVQVLFFVGLGFVMLGAILIIMNALVISVLERTSEIGTMRGLGASSSFIRKLFIIESTLLTFGASIIGIVTGIVLVVSVRKIGISVANPLLISVFGGSQIRPLVGVINIVRHVTIALIVGAASWIYPVSVALKIQPASAMGKGN